MHRFSAILASVLSVSAFSITLAPTAHAQDAAELEMADFQFSSIITADNVYVRSGSSESDYPVVKLSKGDNVIAVDNLKKADKFKKSAKLGILSAKSGELSLESPSNDVFLYHLRLLQLLEQASTADEVRAFHFALLRQVLENVASFLGVGQISYVLTEIGIGDPDDVSRVINTLSHKKVYYFEGDILKGETRDLFDKIFQGLKSKYNFVLHAPKPALVPAPEPEEVAAP